MIEEVNSWLRVTILPSIEFGDLNQNGNDMAWKAKFTLFQLAETMYLKMNLPLTNTSLYFRGINFEIRHVSVFGIDDRDLDGFNKVRKADAIKKE